MMVNKHCTGGLIPSAVVLCAQLFAVLKLRPEANCTVRCSYLEIYNEVLIDLLDLGTQPSELAIQEDLKDHTAIRGLKCPVVTSEAECLAYLFEVIRHLCFYEATLLKMMKTDLPRGWLSLSIMFGLWHLLLKDARGITFLLVYITLETWEPMRHGQCLSPILWKRGFLCHLIYIYIYVSTARMGFTTPSSLLLTAQEIVFGTKWVASDPKPKSVFQGFWLLQGDITHFRTLQGATLYDSGQLICQIGGN